MRVYSKAKLRDFWRRLQDAENPLKNWYRLVEKSNWQSLQEIRLVFGRKVDQVAKFTVFDLGGNKFRLIAVICLEKKKVYIRHVLTHKEYDRGEWKKGE